MKVKIVPGFCLKGQRQGLPCVNVFRDAEGKEMTTNEIVSEVLEYRGKISLIGIVARLTEDGDMVQLIRILSEGGFKVIVYSDTSDDASSLVYIKSISFSLEFAFPTDETKSMNHQSLNSLREGDEIVVATADKASLEFAIKALREKIFTRPDIVFLVPEELNSTIMKNKYTCTVRVIN